MASFLKQIIIKLFLIICSLFRKYYFCFCCCCCFIISYDISYFKLFPVFCFEIMHGIIICYRRRKLGESPKANLLKAQL